MWQRAPPKWPLRPSNAWGGMGILMTIPQAVFFEMQNCMKLGGGTSEIRRMVIGRDIFREKE